MSLYSRWRAMAEAERTPQQDKAFWDEYFGAETKAYKKILDRKSDFFNDKLSALAEQFEMSLEVFSGFMDGINGSLEKPCELEKLKDGTEINLEVNFDKLYYNMLEAKAKWLYSLEEWDGILTGEQRRAIRDKWRLDKQAVSDKTGRNEPCPCGSGKKYKKCCGASL